MPPYIYTPLPSDGKHIRLLRILPSLDDDAPIRCQLIHYALTRSRRGPHLYEALSYVWGDPNKRKSIFIDGAQFDVTVNLHVVLRRLRDPALERTVWIDACCINQKDVEERSRQVQFMAEIYHAASRVLVWLGVEADESNLAMDAIHAASAGFYPCSKSLDGGPPEHNHVDEAEPSGTSNVDYDIVEGDSEPVKKKREVRRMKKAITTLLRRLWFQRVWVLQEAASARTLSILCGPTELTGPNFCDGLEKLERDYWYPRSLEGKTSSIIFLLKWAIASAGYGLYSKENESFTLNIRPLPQLLDMFHTHHATDIRDKVYAILGMSPSIPRSARLFPDYNREWSVLYENLIRFTLGVPDDSDIYTSNNSSNAIIRCKGYVAGYIEKPRHIGTAQQEINVRSRYSSKRWMLVDRPLIHEKPFAESRTIYTSAKPVHTGDVILVLEGARNCVVARPRSDHFALILVGPDFQTGFGVEVAPWASRIEACKRHMYLSWDLQNSFPARPDPQLLSGAAASRAEPVIGTIAAMSHMARFHEDSGREEAIQKAIIEPLNALNNYPGNEGRSFIEIREHLRLLENVNAQWHTYMTLAAHIEYCLNELYGLSRYISQKGDDTDARQVLVHDSTLRPDVLEIALLLQTHGDLQKTLIAKLCNSMEGVLDHDEYHEALKLLITLFGYMLSAQTIADVVIHILGSHKAWKRQALGIIKAGVDHSEWLQSLLSTLLMQRGTEDLQLSHKIFFTILSAGVPLGSYWEDGALKEAVNLAASEHSEQLDHLVQDEYFCSFVFFHDKDSRVLQYLHELCPKQEIIGRWESLKKLTKIQQTDLQVDKVVQGFQDGSLPDISDPTIAGRVIRTSIRTRAHKLLEAICEMGEVDLNVKYVDEEVIGSNLPKSPLQLAAIEYPDCECSSVLLEYGAKMEEDDLLPRTGTETPKEVLELLMLESRKNLTTFVGRMKDDVDKHIERRRGTRRINTS